jgi:hypothetical protein
MAFFTVTAMETSKLMKKTRFTGGINVAKHLSMMSHAVGDT